MALPINHYPSIFQPKKFTMNVANEIKDVLDYLCELQTLAIEDAGLAFRQKDYPLQKERMIIAYTFSNAAATLSTMYLTIILQKDNYNALTAQQILHICQIQNLLATIHLYNLKGEPLSGINIDLFNKCIQQAIECYTPNS